MAYRLLKTSELSSVPVGYSMVTGDLLQATVGAQTAGPSLSTIKLELGELFAWSVTPSNTFSLWVSGTDDNVYNRSGGNVGIGTAANPEQKLTVNGPISARGEGTFEGGLSAKGGNGYFSGNVGIGTTTPRGLLHVAGSSDPTVYIGNNLTTTTGGTSRLRFHAADGTVGNAFDIAYHKSDGVDRLTFIDGGLRDIVTFENGGNVGIGTTEPGAILDVRDRLRGMLARFQRNDNTTIVSGIRINAPNAGTHTYLDIAVDPAERKAGLGVGIGSSTLPLNQESLDNAAIVWDTDGNVGIGTTTPAYKLDVLGDMRAGGSTVDDAKIYLQNSQNTWSISTYSGSKFHIYDVTNSPSTPRLTIALDGNVGIGTTTPQDNLEIRHQTEHSPARLTIHTNSNTSGKYAALMFKVMGGNTNDAYRKAGIFFENDGSGSGRGDLHFCMDSVADSYNVGLSDSVMSLTQGGNLGIGTDSPGEKLHLRTPTENEDISLRIDSKDYWYYITNEGLDGAVKYRSDIGISQIFKVRESSSVYHDALTIKSDGDVGISNSLTVDGDVSILGGGNLHITDAVGYASIEMKGELAHGAYIDLKNDSSDWKGRILLERTDQLQIQSKGTNGTYFQCSNTSVDSTQKVYFHLSPGATAEAGYIGAHKQLVFDNTSWVTANGASNYRAPITAGTEFAAHICTNINADLLDGEHKTKFGAVLDSSGTDSDASWKIVLKNSDGTKLNEFQLGYARISGTSKAASFNNGLATDSKVQFKAIGVGMANTTDGTIRATSDIVAYATSDRRLKDNVTPISNSLETLHKITGVKFDWNNKQDIYEGPDVGVIAQEVEEALGLDNVVTTRADGYKAVKYEKLIPVLIEAVKTLSERVKTLEER